MSGRWFTRAPRADCPRSLKAMTKLTKKLDRQTEAFHQAEPLIVELHPKHLVLRVKNSRDPYARIQIGYEQLFRHGQKIGGLR